MDGHRDWGPKTKGWVLYFLNYKESAKREMSFAKCYIPRMKLKPEYVSRSHKRASREIQIDVPGKCGG